MDINEGIAYLCDEYIITSPQMVTSMPDNGDI